jgi:ribosomal protein S18 acetylase RimI-like enzyme
MNTNDSYSIELDEQPQEKDLQYLLYSIRKFNLEVTGHDRPRTVACFIRDQQGRIIGGAQGDLWGTSMHIGGLWVAENERGKGLGSDLMKTLENHAASKGHLLAYVETTSFQALPFYEGLGYEIFGTLPGIAKDCTLYFLRKDLKA